MKKKILLSFLLSAIIICTATLPSFAVDNSHFEYVTSINLNDDTHYSGNVSDYNNIVFTKVGGTDTRIYNSGSSYQIPIVYYSPSYWVAGQTYRIEFIFTASNIDGMSVCLSTTQKLTEGEQLYIVNDNPAKVGVSYNYSFAYSGQPYLIFTFIMPAKSTCVISDIEVFTYNPNAVVESQNQEIIEQNSELHSDLFSSDDEIPTMGDLDTSANDALIKDFFASISANFHQDLVIGVKGFTYYFNIFFNRLLKSAHGSAISSILTFSLLTSAVALLLGIIRDLRKHT